ncbi:MAG: hypothetical protein ACYSYL_14600, partial [Planctomycetota bacterium]
RRGEIPLRWRHSRSEATTGRLAVTASRSRKPPRSHSHLTPLAAAKPRGGGAPRTPPTAASTLQPNDLLASKRAAADKGAGLRPAFSLLTVGDSP